VRQRRFRELAAAGEFHAIFPFCGMGMQTTEFMPMGHTLDVLRESFQQMKPGQISKKLLGGRIPIAARLCFS
jgi:hypothetical protein